MLQKKEITFLISSLAGGGAEGVCVNLANYLAEQGWKVTLITLHLHKSVYHTLVSDSVTLEVLNVSHARGSIIPLYKYLKQTNTRKVLVFNYELTVILVFIRYISRMRLKILARNINNFSKKMRASENFWLKNIVNPLITKGYCKADHIVNQCHDMETDLLDFYPQLKDRTSVIFNPVNLFVEQIGKTSAIKIENSSQKYFLCVGRLEKQKAFHNAIYAFAKVASTLPDYKLKIVGQGSLLPDLKKLVDRLGLAHQIEFEGFHSNIISFYQGAHATLLTSDYEGFPNVLVESITLGIPVISFDCPSGPREILKHGVNGFLIPHGDIDSFANAIEKTTEITWDKDTVKKTAEKFSIANIGMQYASLLSG